VSELLWLTKISRAFEVKFSSTLKSLRWSPADGRFEIDALVLKTIPNRALFASSGVCEKPLDPRNESRLCLVGRASGVASGEHLEAASRCSLSRGDLIINLNNTLLRGSAANGAASAPNCTG
jgi:hypothetical protein